MSHLLSRARTSASNLDLPAPDELRERILDAVEQAIDRVGTVIEDAPSPSEAAHRMRRHTRNVELASAAIVAGAPALARAAHERIVQRRAAKSVVAFVPVSVAVSRPLLIGSGVVGGVVASALVLRAIRKRRAARHVRETEQSAIDATRFDVDAEVARMQYEGGNPAGSEQAQTRRFVRSGGESPS